MEFLNEQGSSLGLLVGCVDIKLDGSSVEFDRGFVGILVLAADAVAVAYIVERASDLSSGVR